MELIVLDRDWLTAAVRICVGRQFGVHGASLRVQYWCDVNSSDAMAHFQVFEAGCLVEWAEGDVAEPDLCLRQPSWAQRAMFLRRGSGAEVLEATDLADAVTGGTLLAPPMDEVRLSWYETLPTIETLGPFSVQQKLFEGPFGEVDMFVRLDRGRVTDVGLGLVEDPEVVVARRYSAALRERMGAVDVLASLDGGWLDGDFRYVSAFLGLYETDECVEGRRGLTTSCCEPLAVLGDILSSPDWSEVAEELAALGDGVVSVP